MADYRLMKGNEVIAEAAIRCGCDGYFGYPITPQSEIMETLMLRKPWEETGMVVLQAESEVAAINMVYGGAGCGKKVMTSSSSPGISLKMEGITYIAGAELPCLVVNVVRGGPGLGTIQPAQSDYFQATKGGGHGDYHLIVLAPASVQEMNDFVDQGFDLAFKYLNPVMILTDGIIGQMMEKVKLSDYKPRWTEEEIKKISGKWATTGKTADRDYHIITSLELDSARQEKSVTIAREKGIKVGLIRPITLFPYPKQIIGEMANRVKGFLAVEMSAGQMVEDVRLAVNGKVPVEHYGRLGGMIPTPNEVVQALEEKLLKGK